MTGLNTNPESENKKLTPPSAVNLQLELREALRMAFIDRQVAHSKEMMASVDFAPALKGVVDVASELVTNPEVMEKSFEEVDALVEAKILIDSVDRPDATNEELQEAIKKNLDHEMTLLQNAEERRTQSGMAMDKVLSMDPGAIHASLVDSATKYFEFYMGETDMSPCTESFGPVLGFFKQVGIDGVDVELKKSDMVYLEQIKFKKEIFDRTLNAILNNPDLHSKVLSGLSKADLDPLTDQATREVFPTALQYHKAKKDELFGTKDLLQRMVDIFKARPLVMKIAGSVIEAMVTSSASVDGHDFSIAKIITDSERIYGKVKQDA